MYVLVHVYIHTYVFIGLHSCHVILRYVEAHDTAASLGMSDKDSGSFRSSGQPRRKFGGLPLRAVGRPHAQSAVAALAVLRSCCRGHKINV